MLGMQRWVLGAAAVLWGRCCVLCFLLPGHNTPSLRRLVAGLSQATLQQTCLPLLLGSPLTVLPLFQLIAGGGCAHRARL